MTISFAPDGTILDASQMFLDGLGYRLDEVKGKHHRIFCDPEYTRKAEYDNFWRDLNNGRANAGQFMRFKKDGSYVWIEATYIPVTQNGKVVKIFKIAQDITVKYQQLISQEALFKAFDRSNALIEFTPTGNVITANANFLNAMGYKLEDIKGQHHRMFCFDDFYSQNPQFWADLANGHYKHDLYQRKTRYGDIIWLEATYNPIFGDNGKVTKIVKIATDVTDRINKQLAIQKAAEVAHSTSVQTAQVSENGATILSNAVNTADRIVKDIEQSASLIEELNHQSAEISKIVTTIGAIAAQTNLLALNAAIEAARAGENGRGFAVVADEVRNLAARTTQSTGEIDQMVVKNTQLVSNAKSAMSHVTQQASDNSKLIMEASGIIDEILKGAEHVSVTVGQLVNSSDHVSTRH